MAKEATSTPASTSSASVAYHKFSCLTCRQRKIKCDRQCPCSHCVKNGIECYFVAPVRGKRKRTKPPREGLHAKLRRYEELLKTYGAKVEAASDTEDSDGDSPIPPQMETNTAGLPKLVDNRTFGVDQTQSKLVVDGDRTRYFESVFWSNLGNEFRHPDEFESADDDLGGGETDMFLGMPDAGCGNRQAPSLANYFPSLQLAARLKLEYVERVDALMKIIHVPTLWASVSDAIENPAGVSKEREAQLFCFAFATISTFSEANFQGVLGGSRAVLYPRYRMLARQSLSRAALLQTTSLLTLQSFCLFLVGEWAHSRQDVQLIQCGVALRLARKMGLHRDAETLGMPPFETEMRRRLWWHIACMDFRASDMCGVRPSLDIVMADTKVPINVPDEDLAPGMTVLPPERKGITPMVICLVRCEIMEFLRRLALPVTSEVRWEVLSRPDVKMETKDKLIDDLEDQFERKYLRYCDAADPFHLMTSVIVRSGLCKLRLFAHNPRQFAERGSHIPESERDVIFKNATKLLEYAIMVRRNSEMAKYMWRSCYLWDTILRILIAARHRKLGPEVDRLWKLIGDVVAHYPTTFQNTNGNVYKAMRKWTLEVWDDYIANRRAAGLEEVQTPDYILSMKAGESPAATGELHPDAMLQGHYAVGDPSAFDNYNVPTLGTLEMDPNEWIQWEQLLFEQENAPGFNPMRGI